MPLGQASGFSRADPGGRGTPRFRHRLIRFRHFIGGSLALASLNLACRDQVPTFPQRSPPSLLTTAARGGLRPAPDCRPRRALLHLSYSSAPLHADGAFVTHAPEADLRADPDTQPPNFDPFSDSCRCVQKFARPHHRVNWQRQAARSYIAPYTAMHDPPHPRAGGSRDVITDRLQEVLRDTLGAAFGNIREAQQ
jgi:hypothetical protein